MSNSTIDHDEIRKWAESKGGKPAAVDRTHGDGDVGIIRIMFPDNPRSEHQALVEISWDEFFEQFEESQLALVYEEDRLFSKIVGRDTLDAREHGEHTNRRHLREEGKASGGEAGGSKAGSSKAGGGKAAAKSESGKSEGAKSEGSKAADGDLKSREYRDEQGNVHHHTTAYMEQHGGKG